ncbi:MAG: hypothetical protein ACLPVO_06185 [Desulfomonilaceae bacterium]|jgi:hypothetical protein|nr:hypothetical protein [Syntrophaceae bacterium]
MDLDKRIDDLVEAGWHVLDTDYDERALEHWKEATSAFLIDFLGRRHVVTESFISCWHTKYPHKTADEFVRNNMDLRDKSDQHCVEV